LFSVFCIYLFFELKEKKETNIIGWPFFNNHSIIHHLARYGTEITAVTSDDSLQF
jgi:hypothetical protein